VALREAVVGLAHSGLEALATLGKSGAIAWLLA
jgi:hypothetical protein